MTFWPSEIFIEDIEPPQQLLERIAAELESRSSILKARIRLTPQEDRVVLTFIIKNLRSDQSINLFEVAHRPDHSYPAAIIPPTNDLPGYLRKSKFIPGKPPFGGLDAYRQMIEGTRGRWEENEWVCATPDELESQLRELLEKSYVKARIISLLHIQTIEPAKPSNLQPAESGESSEDAKDAQEKTSEGE